MLPGPPNAAGFEYGQENTYFRIGLVLVILKVVFPDLGLLKQLCIIRETDYLVSAVFNFDAGFQKNLAKLFGGRV